MNTQELFDPKNRRGVWIVFVVCVLISICRDRHGILGAARLRARWTSATSRTQTATVSLSAPNCSSPAVFRTASPAPGVVYIHGYQNNRETSDAYCIEMARRGFVVLEIDALGRGNSGNPGDM